MPTFSYKAYARDGRLETGEVSAASQRDALRILESRGLLPSEAREASSATEKRAASFSLGRAKIVPKDLSRLLREMAVLLRADLPMDQVFKLITRQPRPAPAKKLVEEIAAKVSSGALLSDALHKSSISLPDFVPSLIKAGEARGNLGPALHDIADFLDMQIDLRSSIRSALTYPMILVVAAFVVLTIIMTTLVPALMPLFEDAGAEPPFMLTLISGAMSAAVDHAALLTMGTVSVLGLLLLARGNTRLKRQLDAARLRVPLIGPVRQMTGLTFFAKTLGTLLKSGVPLVAALGIATDVVSNQAMAAAFAKAIEDVKGGRSLAQSLKETGFATDTLLGFVEVGENSGKLDEMLLHAASVLDKEVKENVGRAMALLTPALTVLIGLAVGGLILSVMQAILSVNDLSVR